MTACELIKELQKASPDASVYVGRNFETGDEWLELVDRIQLTPRLILICDEETQI